MKLYALRAYLAVHLLAFVLSCILGPRRGHHALISALGGLALGPLNLLLIFMLDPPERPRQPPRTG